MIDEILHELLNGNTSAADRVYPSNRPDSQTPALTWDEVGSGSMVSSRGPQGVAMARVQITMFGATKAEVNTLAREVRVRLNGYTGPAAGQHVQHCLLIPGSRRTVPAFAPDNEQQTEHGLSMDFSIFHTEPTF